MEVKILHNVKIDKVSNFRELRSYYDFKKKEFIVSHKKITSSDMIEVASSGKSSLGMFYEALMRKAFITALRSYFINTYHGLDAMIIRPQRYSKMVKIEEDSKKHMEIFVIYFDGKVVCKFALEKYWIYGDALDLYIFHPTSHENANPPKVINHIRLKSDIFYKIESIDKKGNITITSRKRG